MAELLCIGMYDLDLSDQDRMEKLARAYSVLTGPFAESISGVCNRRIVFPESDCPSVCFTSPDDQVKVFVRHPDRFSNIDVVVRGAYYAGNGQKYLDEIFLNWIDIVELNHVEDEDAKPK